MTALAYYAPGGPEYTLLDALLIYAAIIAICALFVAIIATITKGRKP